jgi:hypothetical protein
MVDSAQIARAAGNLRAQNMVVVGAASTQLDFEPDALVSFVELLFSRKGEKIVELNTRAFWLGRAAGLFFRGLVDGGVPAAKAIELCKRIDAASFDPVHAAPWAEAIQADAGLLDAVLTGSDPVPCDRVAAK